MNHFIVVVFDSCRFDTFTEARTKHIARLGEVERRWSYASWTAPSHYNLLTGLMPHSSPKGVFASEYYKKDFLKFNERLGTTDPEASISFKSIVPHLYFPLFLKKLGYQTHAMVSLPVLNPRTVLNTGFDTFELMDDHNDMRAMLKKLTFEGEAPHYYLLNVGETHYPYALPDEPKDEWPRIHGVHGVFKHLDSANVGGEVDPFNHDQLAQLRARQVDAVSYLDGVLSDLYDLVPDNTWITVTSDHGELFGEGGYFGHGPVQHDKVFEVPFVEGKLK